MAVPTGPRYLQDLVAVEGRTLRRSPRMSALPLAPHWAPCSIVLPSLAGCSPGLPGIRVGRRRGKVRACRSSLQSVKRSACSRCRSFTVLEETINKRERTRSNEQRDVHPFVNVQCHAHRGPSACCASLVHYTVINVSSHDLDKSRTRFTT